MKCLKIFAAASLLVSVIASASEPATDAWDYLVFSNSNDLNVRVGDPTSKCEKVPRITALGHLGWEMVLLTSDFSKESSKVSGVIELGPLTKAGQRGSVQLQTATNPVPVQIFFKRRRPHISQDVKDCPP